MGNTGCTCSHTYESHCLAYRLILALEQSLITFDCVLKLLNFDGSLTSTHDLTYNTWNKNNLHSQVQMKVD